MQIKAITSGPSGSLQILLQKSTSALVKKC